uniref:Uncharacterized protein n=2 Tax=Oryza TaxID=4527 RepID=A0A0E0H201_ORYNI
MASSPATTAQRHQGDVERKEASDLGTGSHGGGGEKRKEPSSPAAMVTARRHGEKGGAGPGH